MARERNIEVAALNIAANPHPENVYVDLLERAATFLVRVRGHEYGKITSPKRTSDGLYIGRVLIWTEIDVTGPWLDLKNEDALSPDLKAAIQIPEGVKPNFKVFNYVFAADRHRLYFESKNEFGQQLGPTAALFLFRNLLSQEMLGFGSPEVKVTVVPDHGAIQRVLSLPGLRKLEITVVLPNPDADADAEARVFGRLNAANASSLTEIYTKQSGADHLVATAHIRETAEVAAVNGEVTGIGRTNGARQELSTKNLPKRVPIKLSWGTSFVARLTSLGLF